MKKLIDWKEARKLLLPLGLVALVSLFVSATAPEGWPVANTLFITITGILGWGLPALLRLLKFHEWLADHPKWGKVVKFVISWGLSAGIGLLAAAISGKLKEWKNLNDIMAMLAYARIWVEFAYNTMVKTWIKA